MKKHLDPIEERSPLVTAELHSEELVITRSRPTPDLAMRGRGRAGPPRPVFKPPSLTPGRGRGGKAPEEEKKEEQK